MCCYVDFIHKNKTNNKDSKIIIPFPLARTHSKLALEHKAANIDDALVSLTLTLSKYLPDCYYRQLSGIDISCLFSYDRFSLISSDSANFVLYFSFGKLLPMILKLLIVTHWWFYFFGIVYKDVTFCLSDYG